MSDSIVYTETISGEILRFKQNSIPFYLNYDPDSDFCFVVSAKDSSGVVHAKANNDLAIALNELFEAVK